MPYVGRTPSAVPVTVDDIPANSIDASKIVDGSIELAEIADNSITDAKLNSSKLDGIETGATNYIHPTTHATADIADNAITEAKIADAAVVSLKSGRKNLIINGDMQVWQRGTSFSTNGYTSDRWYMSTNGTMSAAKTWSSDLNMYYFDASNTVSWGVYQKVEDKNCNHLKTGDTITISFWSNTAMSIQFGVSSIATAVYSTSVIDTIGSWSRRSVAITMTSTLINGIQAGNPIYVEVKPNASGSFGFTGVQLELGSVATDFEHRSYGEELALCQRYYEVGGYGAWARVEGSGGFVVQTEYKVEKRAVPTVIALQTSNVRFREFGVADRDASTMSLNSTAGSVNGGYMKVSGWSGLTTSKICGVNYTTTSDSGDLFAYDAEL